MSAGAVTLDVEGYLRRLCAALDDLPAGEVDEIVADVRVSLEESNEPGRPADPESYADELRQAAGLPKRPADGRSLPVPTGPPPTAHCPGCRIYWLGNTTASVSCPRLSWCGDTWTGRPRC